MIETIKEKIWEILKKKGISLAMIYDCEGKILWHKGRKISGRNITKGDGFCKSVIKKCMKDNKEISKQDQYITFSGEAVSQSAKRLMLKHIMIQPVEDFFLYIDSGNRIDFTEVELEKFRMLGSLLGEAISQMKRSEKIAGGNYGDNDPMRRVKDLIIKYSLEEDCILLLGETGVGKTHTAELIHRYSGRKGPFIVVDTTTINENLFESEIFGHIKGAFTGAISDKKGLVDEAEEGTLFLDEIAEVPVSFQAKLLRFIEKKRYRVVGDPAEKKANVRIIAATNRNLKQMIKDKEFREDIYYRLSVLIIKIPSLKDRKNDIKKIIEENKRLLKGKDIGPGFWDHILDYSWPGNYRELFSVLKRVGLLCNSPISGGDIKKIIDENISLEETIDEQNRIDLIWKELESGRSFWKAVKEPFLDRELNRYEVKGIISKALSKVGGKYVNTLDLLNIDRSDYNKLIKFLHKNRIN
ncbi:sigma 54-interacting transcriptional regulator [Acidobacteriota bacterium]